MSDDWDTPKWLLELIFDGQEYYDPCPRKGTGGLDAIWPERKPVFINPPFSDPLPWVRKAAAHDGEVVMLLPLDPTTKWWTYSKWFRRIGCSGYL